MRLFGSTRMLMIALLLDGCASTYNAGFPQEAQDQVDKTVSFAQVKKSPLSAEGTVIIVGGEVLSATRLKDHTRVMVLQLPLEHTQAPSLDRTQSQGRFITRQTKFLDPATIPAGTRVTLIGEVTGATTELLDEMEYTYPTLTIKHLKVWPEATPPPYGYRPYSYYPGSYWGWGPYWGPYWGRYGGFWRPFPLGRSRHGC